MKYAAYRNYKAHESAWTGTLPSHWNTRALKRIFKIVNGATPASSDENYWDGGIVWITPEDLGKNSSKTISESRRQISRDGLANCGASKTPSGSLVLSTRAPIGHIAITAVASTTNQGARTLVFRTTESSIDFYYYVLLASKDLLQAAGKGTTFLELSAGQLGGHLVPNPPPDEQQAIARFLDAKTTQIDELVAQKRQLIAKLKEKRSALIARTVTRGLPPEAAKAAGLEPNPEMKDSAVDWLGKIPERWQLVSLFRVAQSIQTGPFGTQLHHADYVDDEVPLINPVHLVDGKLQPDNKNTVTPETAERLSRYKLTSGEIVFARRGDIGRCGVVLPEQEGWLCGTGSMIVRLLAQYCDSHYYTLVFQSSGFRSLLELNAVGTTMLNLNPSILGRMIVPVPPLLEQQSIVVFIENETAKIDSLIQQVEFAITRLTEYRQALITSAVTGKIDVRGLA